MGYFYYTPRETKSKKIPRFWHKNNPAFSREENGIYM
jgi:hypothetical protein